ncbi:hypothetical protein N9N28_01460 [Rubripirellula amarantea]|nr:hypothetical protein [Rubripirellula amarantea]
MSRTRTIIGAVVLLLLGTTAYQAIQRSASSIRPTFAVEQCQIFAEMADKAAAALSDHPPDAKEAVRCLEYAHNYYPSGTKQVHGSQLDAMVESSRHASEQRIIEKLKATTGSDLGSDAATWIEHFTK